MPAQDIALHAGGGGDGDHADGVKLNRYGVPVSQGLLGRPRAQRRASVGGKWTAEEDAALKDIVEIHGAKSWKKVREGVSMYWLLYGDNNHIKYDLLLNLIFSSLSFFL